MAEVLTLWGKKKWRLEPMLLDFFNFHVCGNMPFVHAQVNASAEATSVYMSL